MPGLALVGDCGILVSQLKVVFLPSVKHRFLELAMHGTNAVIWPVLAPTYAVTFPLR